MKDEALKPEQEPVGKFAKFTDGIWREVTDGSPGQPLYTTAQRKPLTHGEIYTAYVDAANQTLRPQDERIAIAFARAIEAAHGIGSEPT